MTLTSDGCRCGLGLLQCSSTYMDLLTLKFIHIAAACVFVGNNLVTPLWKFLADRTRDPRIVAYAQRLVTITDLVFTVSSVTGLLITGHLMAHLLPQLWQERWFICAYGAFALSGMVWLAVLLPLQLQQARLARAFASANEIPPRYWTLVRRWNIAGTCASLLPFASLFWMVVKR